MDGNRLAMPPKWREALGKGVVLGPSPEARCLLAAPAGGLPGKVVPLDSRGRIRLPQQLRQHAGIEDTAQVIGSLEHFELWASPEISGEELSDPELRAWRSHEWVIDYVEDGVSWAHCKKCPATRGFPATMLSSKRQQIHLGFEAGKREKASEPEATAPGKEGRD